MVKKRKKCCNSGSKISINENTRCELAKAEKLQTLPGWCPDWAKCSLSPVKT